MHSAAQNTNGSKETSFNIQINVRKVQVPVVVRNKQGNAVGDLQIADFQVFDNGKLRPITGFTVIRREAQESAAQSTISAVAEPPVSVPERRNIVFLFDDMHMEGDDMVHAQNAGLKALATTLTASDLAGVISTSGRINTGLTRDRAKLQAAIVGLHSQSLHRSDGSDCPRIDYYEADLMENKRDAAAFIDAFQQVVLCGNLDPTRQRTLITQIADSAARRSLAAGYYDVQAAFATIKEIVRALATLPGQRSLILVSPGFLNIESDSLTAESKIIDSAAQSNVTISALDARGLYTSSMAAGDDTHVISVLERSELLSAEMRESENPMAELAAGTGGTFFHNDNDMEEGFREVTQTPEFLYLLELSVGDVKPDASYHRLNVKVDRRGLQLQARLGYFVPKPEKLKK
jgi:VWFA-related protein